MKKRVVVLPKDGLISLRVATKYEFIPRSVIVGNVPLPLAVPSWNEAFRAVIGHLKASRNDDLHWIEKEYTNVHCPEDADPKACCLWKHRSLSKILGMDKDQIVFVVRR